MQFTAEIVSIGDELTSGQRLDTNSQWLSQQLNDLGVRVVLHTTVADDEVAMEAVFRAAIDRSDIVISTGGLGPTADDLTRQVLARVAAAPLRLDQPSLDHIKSLFAQRNRQMSESNVAQAYFPEGGKIIANQFGTAPGIDFHFTNAPRRCRWFALPGVPAELKMMWQDYVAPQIVSGWPTRRVICHHSIHCFGAGESEIESRLPDIIRRGRQPQVGITASKATITLRISAEADSEIACQELIQPTAMLIRDTLGDLVFGDSGETLQQVVVRMLQSRHQTLAVVDFGLEGLVANYLNRADTEMAAFVGGWIMRNHADIQATARAARDFFDSDWVLAVGPLRSSPGNNRRDVWLLDEREARHETFDGNCHPDLLPERSVKQALNWLRLSLK